MNTQTITYNHRRVVVGLSGGVDSAVAAAMLKEQGYDVHGVALRTWHVTGETDDSGTAEAAAVATALGIPLHVCDVRTAFYRDVVQPFAAAYAQGRTPNPCVMCNPGLKFATLVEQADRLQAQWIATGHYARIEHPTGGPARLLIAADRRKDQSYALYRLTQQHLRRMLLPLGHIEGKAAVRALARERHLPSAETGESQDLCFMRGGDYRSLLAQLKPDALHPGPILDETGTQLGEHAGLAHYTVGQRSGLGIAAAERLYVVRLRPEDNAIIVGPRSSLERRTCTIDAITFTSGAPPATTFTAQGRIRYHAPLVNVDVCLTDDHRAGVQFATPQLGVAPGQSLVLYRDEELLGGGIIAESQVQETHTIK